MNEITKETEFESLLSNEGLVLTYFSSQTCNVCRVLKPKIIDLIEIHYPKIMMVFVDTEVFEKLAAQNQVFTIPTILIFLDGKEILRESRNISLGQFKDKIDRFYQLIFS